MNIKLNKISGGLLLFDGRESDFYKTHTIKLENGYNFSLSPDKLIDLESFEKHDKRDLISTILTNTPTIKRHAPTIDFIYYKNSQGLHPFVKEDEKHLAIISLGELQPERYQIYIDAIFKKIISS